jgi:hypothetical protein
MLNRARLHCTRLEFGCSVWVPAKAPGKGGDDAGAYDGQ